MLSVISGSSSRLNKKVIIVTQLTQKKKKVMSLKEVSSIQVSCCMKTCIIRMHNYYNS